MSMCYPANPTSLPYFVYKARNSSVDAPIAAHNIASKMMLKSHRPSSPGSQTLKQGISSHNVASQTTTSPHSTPSSNGTKSSPLAPQKTLECSRDMLQCSSHTPKLLQQLRLSVLIRRICHRRECGKDVWYLLRCVALWTCLLLVVEHGGWEVWGGVRRVKR
jgi:hypothetical protein